MPEIKLPNGQVALVDEQDLEKVLPFHWYQASDGYVVAVTPQVNGCKRIRLRLHRVVMDAPKELQVDHIDGNKLDCRRSNLRICTAIQNSYNCRKTKKNH